MLLIKFELILSGNGCVLLYVVYILYKCVFINFGIKRNTIHFDELKKLPFFLF